MLVYALCVVVIHRREIFCVEIAKDVRPRLRGQPLLTS